MPVDLKRPFKPLYIAIVTISDSRDKSSDASGDLLEKRVKEAGHILQERAIIKDDQNMISALFEEWSLKEDIDVIISTGGTGLTGRDVTPEALKAIMTKEIPGFGELFRMISFEKIGTSAIQSRAIAGLAGGTYIFCLPGSPGACRDGWDNILSSQLDYRFQPCNFVELIPRLQEK
jgi:molybdenum cofactor biosynthesis protein B